MRIRMILAVMALVLLVTPLGMSQYSVREDFAYLTGKSIDLLGTAGNGWGGPWAIDTGNAKLYNLAVVADTGYDYTDLYNTAIPHIGSALIVQTPGNWGSGRYRRALDKVWPDVAGQYWISYLFEAKKVPTGNTYYLFKIYAGSGELMAVGKGGGGTTYSCGSGWPGGSGPDVSTTTCQGGPVWLVSMIQLTGNATADVNARTFMWINPDPSTTPDTTAADVKRNTNLSAGFDHVAIEFGGADTMELGYDEIRIGTSFADVSSSLVTPGYLAYDSFTYAAAPNAYITGLGGAEVGWAGPWSIVAGSGSSDSLMTVSTTGIAYGDLTYPVPHTGNQLVGLKDVNVFTRYERPLDKLWPATAGAKYWFSVLMQLKSDTSTNSWSGVKLFNGHGGELMMYGKGWGQDLFTVGSGYHGSSTDPECSTTTWDVGPVWLVGEIFTSGSPSVKDQAYMWINPDPTSTPDTSTADARSLPGISVAGGFDYVRIEFGGNPGYEVDFDELHLGTKFTDVITGVSQKTSKLPTQFALSQNYPNPFNPTTQIEYSIVKTGYMSLKVYNILGQEVATLFTGIQRPGTYQARFNANGLASGVYFYRLVAGDFAVTKKMVLLK